MGTSASFALARKISACLVAALLSLALIPASALAEGEGARADNDGAVASGSPDQSNASTDSSLGEPQGVSAEQDAEGSPVAPMLASGLVGKPNSFINSDVILDSEPVIGSFTVDGLTFAVTGESHVELVGVSEATGASEAEADAGTLTLPESVAYADSEYALSSIAPYAFYLSGVTDVELPASVSDVDDRAFRSSDVASVAVAENNPTYTSFDGALYSADKTRLLLIPEGRVGAVLLPREAEVADPGKFSHCSLVDAISVEDGAAFASENGLLYSSDLTTLLRVPAGAIDITIREGCTTIVAGALEACAKLTTINAPATVTSISPDVFHAIPTVSLPAAAVSGSPQQAEEAIGAGDAPVAPMLASGQLDDPVELGEAGAQLTAMVALSTTSTDLPEVNPSAISVALPDGATTERWVRLGFALRSSPSFLQDVAGEAGTPSSAHTEETAISLDSAEAYSHASYSMTMHPNGKTVRVHGRRESPTGIDIDFGIHYATEPETVTRQFWRVMASGLADGTVNLYFINRPDDFAYNWWEGWVYSSGTPGYRITGWSASPSGAALADGGEVASSTYAYALWEPNAYTIEFDANGGWGTPPDPIAAAYDQSYMVDSSSLGKEHCVLDGWSKTEGGKKEFEANGPFKNITEDHGATATLYAVWKQVDYNIGFDVDSEPGDEDYAGEPKDDQTVNVESGPTVIEDPKRPGYVFQGWVIPGAGGEHALDQDLVYQGGDGKWYVDASKLPDYAGDDGRIELTARWTSVISVDVPSSATFYYDLVTDQSAEAHEAALSGTTSFSSKSQVDLRICGLESKKAAGADSLFSSGADSALLSVYPAPSDKAQTVEGAQQGPAGAKPATAVDFSLDDIVLERAFMKEDADAYKIPAGDDLTLAYRLNLSDAAKLDYDRILAMAEGDEASLASLTYCFAADYNSPADWGEPLWIENPDTSAGAPRFLVLDDIKAAAIDLSSNGTEPSKSAYHALYKSLLDKGASFHLNVGGSYHDVQILGICQDTMTSGAKAGLTFGFKEPFTFRQMNAVSNQGGWGLCAMRGYLNGEFLASLGAPLREPTTGIVRLVKVQQGGSEASSEIQVTRGDAVFLPSSYELYGLTWDTETSENSFQYQWFAKTETYMTGQGSICANKGTIKYRNGSTQFWWARSGAIYDPKRFCHVGKDGTRNFNNAAMALGVVPCFAL